MPPREASQLSLEVLCTDIEHHICFVSHLPLAVTGMIDASTDACILAWIKWVKLRSVLNLECNLEQIKTITEPCCTACEGLSDNV